MLRINKNEYEHENTPLTKTEMGYLYADTEVVCEYIKKKLKEYGNFAEIPMTNCLQKEFNNAMDRFITILWRKSRSMNLKDITSYIYDNANKICVDNVEKVTYFELKRVTRTLVNELDLDRSLTTESMILDEIFNISCFYNRCNTYDEDF